MGVYPGFPKVPGVPGFDGEAAARTLRRLQAVAPAASALNGVLATCQLAWVKHIVCALNNHMNCLLGRSVAAGICIRQLQRCMHMSATKSNVHS
jgi:hypothetical protein